MMMSPDSFTEEHKDKSYKELLTVRDELLDEIRAFEDQTYDPELDLVHPSPAVTYQCNLEYLGKLCELIAEKYNREYVWEETDDDDETDP